MTTTEETFDHLPAVQTFTPPAMSMMPALHQTGETAIAATEARERAEIQARWIMARQCPRDHDTARGELLRDCRRPAFAESARYSLPRGKEKITGWTIRFAEAAIRAWRNVHISSAVVSDDDDKRVIKVTVTDLEAIATYTADVVVRKEVERRACKDASLILRTRKNSYGDTLYILRATDDEIVERQGALVSKAIRSLGLRMIPGWILDDCLSTIRATAESDSAANPEVHRKRLLDAFSSVGIRPDTLKEYCGHDLAVIQPAELIELRELYQAIKDGLTTMREAMDERHGASEATETKADAKAKEAIAKAKKAGGAS